MNQPFEGFKEKHAKLIFKKILKVRGFIMFWIGFTIGLVLGANISLFFIRIVVYSLKIILFLMIL